MSNLIIDVEVLDKEIDRSKVCRHYSRENPCSQYVNYKSLGDTRLSIDGSRHYKTPFGALPSVTTILSATQGNKASLERWNKKNPGKREEAAKRGTAVHSRMEHYLLGEREFPVDEIVDPFWEGLPEKLDMFEDRNDQWFIDQYNRNRDVKDHVHTIEELRREIKKSEKKNV